MGQQQSREQKTTEEKKASWQQNTQHIIVSTWPPPHSTSASHTPEMTSALNPLLEWSWGCLPQVSFLMNREKRISNIHNSIPPCRRRMFQSQSESSNQVNGERTELGIVT
eukprot:GHVL01040251.1.p1 GENE.GHVL01040251.1~~GHVL01040251.1.p1  ORF type:complete len:110 (-),score=13.78 GHVL01040251.1:183-512(-)